MSCPQCSSQKIWKDGIRKTNYGDVQRFLCRVCGYRFSDSKIKVGVVEKRLVLPNSVQDFGELEFVNLFPRKKSFKNPSLTVSKDVGSHEVSVVGKRINDFLRNSREHRVCVSPKRRAKNLVIVEPSREGLAGATIDVKGKILEFAWHLKKQGSAKASIQTRVSHIRVLVKKGANLVDPDSIKEVLAREKAWSDGYKNQMVFTYDKFIKLLGISWTRPKYHQQSKLPFIPLEKELDTLIAGVGKKTGTMLLLLKETGIRIGEALAIEWKDLDFERRIVTINRPEKHGIARQFKLSETLMARLRSLPRKRLSIFGVKWKNAVGINFRRQRKRIAEKMQNPRLMRISFHTFRHWKATMEYHKTKDILHVKRLLGHRRIDNTLIYTQLVSFESDEYHVRTAKTLKEACELAEAGFEYFTTIEDAQIFRKRK